MDYLKNYEFWCNAELSSADQAELAAVKNNTEELKGRFGSWGLVAIV